MFAQKILAWHAAAVRDADLVMTPLKMAIWQRDREGHPIDRGRLIGHSDAGSQGGLNRSSQHLVILEVFDGSTSATGGPGSAACDAFTGAADPGRHVEREFWRLIAQGRRTEDAACEVGVSAPVGSRWFRHAGGMPPLSLAEPTGRYLSFEEREEIALLKAQGLGVRAIARELNRDPGTISRELRRNAATRGGKPEYRASVAQWKAQTAARRPKPAKLVTNPRLREYVQERLCGSAASPGRHRRAGPADDLERTEQAASRGPALGGGLESGADRAAARHRLPRR